MSHYDTLGIRKDASQAEIRQAHRRLAAKWHPDRNDAGEAHDRFVEIQQAYETLSDQSRREYYDEHGADPIRDLDTRARSMLLDGFVQLAGKNEWRPGPYVRQLRESLAKLIRDCRQEASRQQAVIDRLEDMLPETPPGEEENLFAGAVYHANEQCRKKLTAARQQQAQAERALELLEPYRDREDPQQMVQMFMSEAATSTSTGGW